jgi:L-fuconolactonase
MVTEASWKQWEAADFKPYLDIVFDCFGTERLMFGSDWPVSTLSANYNQVHSIVWDYIQQHPPPVQEKILGLNAAKFYSIT